LERRPRHWIAISAWAIAPAERVAGPEQDDAIRAHVPHRDLTARVKS
jgi:hypothetical protein